MNQSYINIECIIVDDATTDDSIDRCKKLIQGYEGSIQFVFLHHEKNRGLSATRNTGTNAATGEYLYYLDGDDEIAPDCINTLISYVLKNNGLEMVQGRYLCINGGDEELGNSDEVSIKDNDDARYQYLNRRKLNYAVWNKLLKRSFVIDNQLYNKESIVCEDLLWTFYLIKYLSNAQLCSDVTYYYHIRSGSILRSGKDDTISQGYVAVFDEIIHHLTPGKERSELKGYQNTFCRVLARYLRFSPDLKRLLLSYQKSALQYGCWSVWLTLSIVGFISRFGNPIRMLQTMHSIKDSLHL